MCIATLVPCRAIARRSRNRCAPALFPPPTDCARAPPTCAPLLPQAGDLGFRGCFCAEHKRVRSPARILRIARARAHCVLLSRACAGLRVRARARARASVSPRAQSGPRSPVLPRSLPPCPPLLPTRSSQAASAAVRRCRLREHDRRPRDGVGRGGRRRLAARALVAVRAERRHVAGAGGRRLCRDWRRHSAERGLLDPQPQRLARQGADGALRRGDGRLPHGRAHAAQDARRARRHVPPRPRRRHELHRRRADARQHALLPPLLPLLRL